jgi:hypothetical protein
MASESMSYPSSVTMSSPRWIARSCPYPPPQGPCSVRPTRPYGPDVTPEFLEEHNIHDRVLTPEAFARMLEVSPG